MRKTRLALTRTRINGQRYFCVTLPRLGVGRKRRFFKDKVEAQTFLRLAKVQQKNYGTAALSMSDALRGEAIECSKLLEPYQKTLRDAAQFYLAHLKTITGSREGEGGRCGSHGHTRGKKQSRTYKSWRNMLARCYYPNDKRFKNYGGRGIQICVRWFKFENFLADMGECPPSLTLERIDKDGHYMPSNCVWDTWARQANNKRNNHRITLGAITKTLSQWCEAYGISKGTVGSRLKHNWSPEKALLTPVRNKR